MNGLNYHHLRYFHAVAKKGSLAAAAARCHRSLQKGPPRVETPASKSPTPLSKGISGQYGLRVF